MRSYRVDDLAEGQGKALTELLQAMELDGGIEGLYWLPVPQDLLLEMQKEHKETCGPHAMALEVGEEYVQLELLVRARNALRCQCIAYASPALEQHMMRYVDDLFAQLNINI